MNDLIGGVVEYLRRYKVLGGNPIFRDVKTNYECVDPRGEWDGYYMQPPFWKNVEVDVHEGSFNEISSQLRKTNLEKVQEKALIEIPDSRNAVIIEFGSSYGTFGAVYLAARKPKANVILISRKWEETKPPESLFHTYERHAQTFTRTSSLWEPNLERRVNGLYRENGIGNVTFYEHEIKIEDMSRPPHFLQNLDGKKIYLFSHKSPKTLPFLVGKLYSLLNARYMCVSLSAQERVAPEEFSWKIVQKNLGLTEKELKGYIKSALDPREAELCDKYDYNDPGQMRIGVMVKLGIALALAKEVKGNVLSGTNPENRYNKADHYVEARR